MGCFSGWGMTTETTLLQTAKKTISRSHPPTGNLNWYFTWCPTLKHAVRKESHWPNCRTIERSYWGSFFEGVLPHICCCLICELFIFEIASIHTNFPRRNSGNSPSFLKIINSIFRWFCGSSWDIFVLSFAAGVTSSWKSSWNILKRRREREYWSSLVKEAIPSALNSSSIAVGSLRSDQSQSPHQTTNAQCQIPKLEMEETAHLWRQLLQQWWL